MQALALKPNSPENHRPMTAPDLAYAAAVLLLAYFVRGISGFGSGLIAVPLLALRFPLPQVVPFMLIADFAASALVGGLHFKHVDWPEIRRLLPATLAGVIIGTGLLVSLPPAVLLGVLGSFILVFAVRGLLVKAGPFTPASPRWAYPAALSGGAVSGLFGTGGPPYVIYLSHRIRDKSALRATLSGLFFLEGLIRIAHLPGGGPAVGSPDLARQPDGRPHHRRRALCRQPRPHPPQRRPDAQDGEPAAAGQRGGGAGKSLVGLFVKSVGLIAEKPNVQHRELSPARACSDVMPLSA
jgi:hypothetical protein